MDNIEFDKLTIGLEEEFEQAKKVDINLEKNLAEIKKHFGGHSKKCEALSKELLKEVTLGGLKGIHSANRRVKDVNSLLRKIIKKKAELSITPPPNGSTIFNESEKYRNVNGKNYFKVTTDLIGLRILIRYRQEWELIDRWIREKFPENYIKDWETEYEPNPMGSFIAEKPKIYYKYADKDLYENVSREKFDLRESKEGYNSFHYIVNYEGCYVEIQVRTILDEAWCECTHDVIYKGDHPNRALILLAKSMSEQVKAAEVITEIIYEGLHTPSQEDGTIQSSGTIEKNKSNAEQNKIFGSMIDKIIERKLGV